MHSVVKSVQRVVDVLELFREHQQPLKAAEICVALDYPNSSANALLKSLVSLGFLSFDTRSRSYFPSLKVTQLGEWIPGHVLSESLVTMLRSLAEQTEETVTLSVQNDLRMQFIKVIPGTHPISLIMTEGYECPLFGTAVGTALLSSYEDAQIERLMARAKRAPDSTSKDFDLADEMQEIDEARQRGFAVAYDRVFQDTGAVGMLLPPELGEQTLVLGVGGLASRIQRRERQIIHAMKHAIQENRVH